jgi:hypothetical protein
MTTEPLDELKVEKEAHQAITAFVNGQKCRDTEDVKRVLSKLLAVTINALDLVTNGKSEKLS